MRDKSVWRRWRRVFGQDPESEVDEELGHHVEERVRECIARGVDPESARRIVLRRLGDLERVRDECVGLLESDRRAERRRVAMSVSWLDLKLGLRMLAKYPGLAVVGGVAMAFAIAIGAFFDVIAKAVYSTLPFEQGERVVAIENWDTEWNDQERRILHDFVAWRDELQSIEDLGAFRVIERNLITPDGTSEPVSVAEMTASGFRLARVPPVLGRPLLARDELEGARVVVIGYDVWQTRFAGAPDIVGQTLQLGDVRRTVVGVMPAGFAFPVNERFWVPLHADPSGYERRDGPAIHVFGRLSPGATLESAQAEVTALGRRSAATYPETHERLRPRVVPYTLQFLDDMTGWEFPAVQLLVALLLAVICVTVATLVYARTATRRGEIAVRNALGASRRRIIVQLFIEALVLTAVAAGAGLMVVSVALGRVQIATAGFLELPFWVEIGLSPRTIAYALGLAVFAAVIVGVVPAVRSTGRDMQSNLRALAGGTGLRFGRTWTALIVTQVTFAVAVLPLALSAGWTFVRYGTTQPGPAAATFLTARLAMDRSTPPSAEAEAYDRAFDRRYAALQAELVRRLEAEAGVSDVMRMEGVPGQEPRVPIEVDLEPLQSGADPPSRLQRPAGYMAGTRRVDVAFFDALNVPILAGRSFHAGDADAASSAVIVNRSFVEQVLDGRSALGRRIRYVSTSEGQSPGRWYEIVGVVDDFPAAPMEPGQGGATLYHAMPPAHATTRIALRVHGVAPETFARRLREVTGSLDPSLRLREILPLNDVLREEHAAMRLGALAIALVAVSVLLLSAAGIYGLTSFTVAQRRREIGIRAALGADGRRILGSVFSRAFVQLAIGIAVGVVIATLLAFAMGDEGGVNGWSVFAVSALMLVVGLLAAVGPARRGLRVQPVDALREE